MDGTIAADGAGDVDSSISSASTGSLGEISVTISADGTAVDAASAGANMFCITIANSDAQASSIPTNPLVMSNQATYYEMWITTTNVGSSDITQTIVL